MREQTLRMRISVSGTFCSGKTMLATQLAERLERSCFVPEVATRARLDFPQLDWRGFDVRSHFFWSQLTAERWAIRDAEVAVLDGSLNDVFAHTIVFGHKVPTHWRSFVEHSYDLTLICHSAGVPLRENGIRETDPGLQLRIHTLVTAEADRYSNRVEVMSGPPEIRLAQALALIEEVRGSNRT